MNNNEESSNQGIDSSKHVIRFTPQQVEVLEKVYTECPKPSSFRRQQLIKDYPLLANVEPKQIKVWFQNRRCREKQKGVASRLQTVNRELSGMNKLLMEENERLQMQLSQFINENGCTRKQLHGNSATTTENSFESMVISGQYQQQQIPSHQGPPSDDANSSADLFAIAEATLAEFLSKATGTAVTWVQVIGMKPGLGSLGFVSISHNYNDIAARACGFVNLEPTKVAEILKDRPSWFRDCRNLNVLSVIPTGDGGTIELVYMQTYAPTTLAAARDFWTMRYSKSLEDGSVVVCERSLNSSTGAPTGPPATTFVRAKMLPSGYLIRPCDGGGSVIIIVDHVDLDAWDVMEVFRPLYESPKMLAQKMTMAALQNVREIADEASGEIQYGAAYPPELLRIHRQRLYRGFNDAVNGFIDDGWSLVSGDCLDDVTITINSSPNIHLGSQYNLFPTSGGVLCAKASMLVQNVSPSMLVRFLRDCRSEWADYAIDAYSAARLKGISHAVPVARPGTFPNIQVISPLAYPAEHQECLEVVQLQSHTLSLGNMAMQNDMYLLQLCSGLDESKVATCAHLIFAPIDKYFPADAHLLPSGFSVLQLDSKTPGPSATGTSDLASRGADTNNKNLISVLTVAFQFTFENHLLESVAAMGRQYVRGVMGSIRRNTMAATASPLRYQLDLIPTLVPSSAEAATLAQWICRSYRIQTGAALIQVDSRASGDVLNELWHHPNAVICCSFKINAPLVFTFANQTALNLLETNPLTLQDMTLWNLFDEAGWNLFCADFYNIMQQGFACLPVGVCVSSMGRAVTYEQAIAWKVLDDNDADHGIALMFVNWFFV